MSERLRVTNNPVSNEEIIKELTEQFEIFPKDDQTQTDTKDNSEGNIIPENKAEAEDSSKASSQSKTKVEKNVLEDFDNDDDDGKNYDSDSDSTDSIDEVALKDEEVVLTEEEKVNRKEEAEELKKFGNKAFGEADYGTSKCKYTEALKICPLEYSQQRAVLYCNRSAAKIHLEKYEAAIKDATKAIELDDKYIKAYHRRATSYERTDKLDECLADYKRILELDPLDTVATKALERLPPLIEARNEKLKTEMMGKLKDLGNMILKPFGLSTDNFQMEQDPETKGYKINFKQ